jgi:hypothetical protein
MSLNVASRLWMSFFFPLGLQLFFINTAEFVNAAELENSYYVAPAPTGNDASDCSLDSVPCATFQRAVDLCPMGVHCFIDAAPGVYSQKTNVNYYKVISIFGPLNKGKCTDRDAAVVDDRINGAAQPGPIFWAQDHSVLIIVCMSLRAYAEGSSGFATRQFSIGDLNEIKFDKFIGGVGVAASEESKINVLSPEIAGDASRFASSQDLSQVLIAGEIKILDNLRFDVAFLSSVNNSIVSVNPSAISGGKAISGASYQCFNSTINRNTALPGGDSPYYGNAHCRISGLASDDLIIDKRLTPIYSQLDKLAAAQSQFVDQLDGLTAVESQFGGQLDKIAAAQSQLDDKLQKTRNEFDANIHAIRVEIRRDTLIVCVVLLTAGLGIFVAWLRRQQRLKHVLLKRTTDV